MKDSHYKTPEMVYCEKCYRDEEYFMEKQGGMSKPSSGMSPENSEAMKTLSEWNTHLFEMSKAL